MLFCLSFSLTSGDNPINYATAFYVTMVVCAVLMITTCILAIIVAYLTVGRFKKCKGVPSVKGECSRAEAHMLRLSTYSCLAYV